MDVTEIGFTRTREESVRSLPQREFTAEAFADGEIDVARIVSFFADHSSQIPFWIRGDSDAVTLTDDLPAGGTRINSPSIGLEAGQWIAFCHGGEVSGFALVQGADATGVNLATPYQGPPGGLRAGETLVSRLSLCRFKADRLNLVFESPDFAAASITFRELDPETDLRGTLSGGIDIGAALPLVWLYRLTTSASLEQWTSHESAVQAGPDLFLPGRINSGDIVSSLSGTRDSVSVTVGQSVSGIARAILAREVFGRARLEVIEADRIGGAAINARVIFSGEVESARKSGVTITLNAKPWPAISETRIGRFRIQPTCNHVLFGAGCGLDSSAWIYSGALASSGACGWPFVFQISELSGPGAPPAENWFAGGWIEVGGDRVPIRQSTAAVDGSVSLTLSRDPRPFPVSGEEVSIYPGCDGRWETCGEKFSNRLNFGGHRLVPASNPSLVKLSTAVNGGKK